MDFCCMKPMLLLYKKHPIPHRMFFYYFVLKNIYRFFRPYGSTF